MPVKIGCCGFPGARNRYFEAFDRVKVQQTFYEPPGTKLLIKWRKEAPAGFEYTIKAWQAVLPCVACHDFRNLK